MEPTLVLRFVTGLLVVCLVVAALAMGWTRAGQAPRSQKVDMPARGGTLVTAPTRASTVAPAQARPAASGQAPAASATQGPTAAPTPKRQGTATVSASRSGGRSAPVHQVEQGETLYRIARRYGVQVAEVKRVNGLASDLIRPGQLLIIPGGSGADSVPALAGTFIWPVLAPISSHFGPRDGRNHNGLDLAANQGDQIRASRDGEVWVAGEVPGYGHTVIIGHQDGSRTLYGHCSELLVKPGEMVRQGQVIAVVGSTGRSTGPHLHFEIIVNDRPSDPLLFLPRR